jgi:hypothetical protein
MKRVIEYTYRTFDLGCGCCSDSSSTYDVWEDDKLVSYDNWCMYCENEQELRVELPDLEPFEVSKDSIYF